MLKKPEQQNKKNKGKVFRSYFHYVKTFLSHPYLVKGCKFHQLFGEFYVLKNHIIGAQVCWFKYNGAYERKKNIASHKVGYSKKSQNRAEDCGAFYYRVFLGNCQKVFAYCSG